MGDRFVDVRYRGLEVGRSLKLRDVSTDGAYLEVPLPMPVGSPIEIGLDDGTRVAAIVALVHEQVGGSAAPPGMRVRPPGRSEPWWRDQPAPLPVVAPPPAVVIDVSAAEPSAPVPAPPVESSPAIATESAPVIVIEAAPPVDSGVIAVEIVPESSGDLSGDVSSSGELPAVDDDVSSSGSHPAVGSNGQPKPGGRSKQKSGGRRKRNTR